MWGSVKTSAIVVAVEPWREADRRYRALTPEGKIEFIGRGARKGKAKLAAHLEPLACVSLELVRGVRQYTVIGVERERAFARVAEGSVHRLTALAGLHLFDALFPFEDPHGEPYARVLDWLHFLEEAPEFSLRRADWYVFALYLRLLHESGFSLSFDRCVSCRDRVVPLSFRYHGPRGGLVCTSCSLKAPADWLGAEQVGEEAVILLRFAQRAPWAELGKLPFSHEAFAEAAERVRAFAEHHHPPSVGAFVKARSFVADYV
jgi:DNA repair protein RecO